MFCNCGDLGRHYRHPSRRNMLGMLGAAGAGAALGLRGARAQSAEWVLDTHHHIYPPRYTNANIKRIVDDFGALPAGGLHELVDRCALEQMDKAKSCIDRVDDQPGICGSTVTRRATGRASARVRRQDGKVSPAASACSRRCRCPTPKADEEIVDALDTLSSTASD